MCWTDVCYSHAAVSAEMALCLMCVQLENSWSLQTLDYIGVVGCLVFWLGLAPETAALLFVPTLETVNSLTLVTHTEQNRHGAGKCVT